MLFSFSSSVYSLLVILFFSLVFLFKWFSNPKTAHKNLPPSPSKLPIIGNLHQVGLLPHRSLRSLAQQYDQLMLLHLGSTPALIVSSADAAREIMKTHDTNFATRPKFSIANRIFHYKDVAFSPYGEYWRQVRGICVVHLLSTKRVGSFRRVREEETSLMLEKIKQSSLSSTPINLTEIFILLANDVVCRVALGKKYSELEGGGKLKQLFRDLSEVLGAFNVGDYIPWLAWLNRLNGLNAKVDKVAKALDTFLEGVVDEHMDSEKRERDGHDDRKQDFVDILLGIHKENTNVAPLQKDSIKALILDMFAAGTETTSTTSEWEMVELLRHPRVMKKLQNELMAKRT